MWGSTRARLAGILLVATAALGLGAAGAQAHTQLLSSTPADGAVLTQAPATVTLVFEEALLPDLDTVSINDAEGVNVASEKITPSGAELSIDWPSGLPAGTYQVAYRVVSADGHPVTGAISFSIGEGSPPGAGPTAGTAPTASAVEVADASSTSPWVFVTAGLLLALSIGVIYALVRRRR